MRTLPRRALSASCIASLFVLGTQAQVNTVGTGCAGASGTVPSLSSPDSPTIGGSINISVNGTPSTPGLLFFGLSNTTYSGLSLPLDLTSFALPGCSLYNSIDVTVPIGTDGTGTWTSPLPVAPSGATMYMQAFMLDFVFPTNYGAMTNGLEVVPVTPGAGGTGEGVIVEIMSNPAAVTDNNGEYIELYNTTDQPVDIEGWRLIDGFIDLEFFLNNGNGIIIPPGGRFTLCTSTDMYVNGGVPADWEISNTILTNGSDKIILQNSSFQLVDRVEYMAGWPKGNGVAMTYDMTVGNIAFNNDNVNNWCKATSMYGSGDLGTPGAVNDPCP